MLPFELTKDTPYLALSGELWSVFYEYFNRNWSCYKGFPLYVGLCLDKLPAASTSKYKIAEREDDIMQCFERAGDISLLQLQELHDKVKKEKKLKYFLIQSLAETLLSHWLKGGQSGSLYQQWYFNWRLIYPTWNTRKCNWKCCLYNGCHFV